MDFYEPSVRELQALLDLLLPADLNFCLLTVPEAGDLFRRYFGPCLHSTVPQSANARGYIAYLQQTIQGVPPTFVTPPWA